MVWLSGCGTIRGAGSRGDDLDERENSGDPFCSVSWCVDRGGGGEDDCAARASATGSGASPSKNFAMAIWTMNQYRMQYVALATEQPSDVGIPAHSIRIFVVVRLRLKVLDS